jgi:hypothetical protein
MSPSYCSHSQVDATHNERRGAFDLEPHYILLHKVCVSGLSDGYVNRSRRYITNRQATVRVYVLGILTSHFEELASITQGPVLEAPFFPVLRDTICV